MKKKIVLLFFGTLLLTACSNSMATTSTPELSTSPSGFVEIITTESDESGSNPYSNIIPLEDYYMFEKGDNASADFIKYHQGTYKDILKTGRGTHILINSRDIYTFDSIYNDTEFELEFSSSKDIKSLSEIDDINISDNIVCEYTTGYNDLLYLDGFKIGDKYWQKGQLGSFSNTFISVDKLGQGSHTYINSFHLENNQLIKRHNCTYCEKDCSYEDEVLDVFNDNIKHIGSISNRIYAVTSDNKMCWVDDITETPIKLSDTVTLFDFERFANIFENTNCSYFMVPLYKKLNDNSILYSINHKLTTSVDDDMEVKMIMPEGKCVSDIVSINYYGFIYKNFALVEFSDKDFYISDEINENTESINLTRIKELSDFNKEFNIQELTLSDWSYERNLNCLTEDGYLYLVKLKNMK